MSKRQFFRAIALAVSQLASTDLVAQGVAPYPNAITDRQFHAKTPMAPPPVNTVVQDPDFGSSIVRVTDQNTNPKHPLSYFRNADTETNMFSADNSKFYVISEHAANLAFAFDPSTMKISPLPGAAPGSGLQLPLRVGPTFSYVDSDLMYGTTNAKPMSVSSYRFSTGAITPLYDALACGTQPALVKTSAGIGDVTISADDSRVSASAGGNQFGNREFVIVFDAQLGCRWYDTKTGQIGGEWGPIGKAGISKTFAIRHTSISGSGRYVKISADHLGFVVWDATSLNVQTCYLPYGPLCGGYGALGQNSYINGDNQVDEMDTLIRPLWNMNNYTHLADPLPLPHYFGMERHFTWANGHFNDKAPVCGSTYAADGNANVTQPYDSEMFCMQTDGTGSTIWRFAHNRAIWDPEYFWSEPFGNVSSDGRFLVFSSGWDNQVGVTAKGDPRSDVWIVKLD